MIRIYELAKKLDISSKDLLSELLDIGIEAKNHMCSLSDEEEAQLHEALFGEVTPRSEKEEKAAPESVDSEKSDAPAATEESVEEATEEPEEEPVEEQKTIVIEGSVIVKDFATMMDMKPNLLIAELMTMNVFASINQTIDLKIVRRIAEKHDFILEIAKKKPPEPVAPPPADEKPVEKEILAAPKKKKKKKKKNRDQEDELHPENLSSRPPVVTFLGHVDHGKTSLLDRIRNARVAVGEDGGITQHIGAYSVDYNDHAITFLDTPGHAAFTAMRARGANLTDIVILVVAADDGLMPQTREAIQHAKAADVCIIVAINKMDLPGANPDRILQQLQQEEVMSEDWGGDIGVCRVSAATGEGLDALLERILLESEMLELEAKPNEPAHGYVIEAQMEPGRGPTATVLVTDGTLKVGDSIVCGSCWGRIKALTNDKGNMVRTAGPATAVKCLGLTRVPEAGDEFQMYPNDLQARSIAEELQEDLRNTDLCVSRKVSLEDLLTQTTPGQKLELPIILKADVKGSIEAITQSLNDIDSDKVSINFVLTGVGNITDNDVLLASASNAIIIGFHVGVEGDVDRTAKHEGVEIRLYSIIYELLDEVREAMTGMLDPITKENVIGHAEIRQIFSVSKHGNIAGCMVRDGRISMKGRSRIQRDGETVYEGTISSLKRFQSDAKEIREGQECGIRLDNYTKYAVGDIIECYLVEKIAQQL